MAPQKWYVVFRGRNPGIYESWPNAQKQVSKFEDNTYKAYESQGEAVEAWMRFLNENQEEETITQFSMHGLGSSSGTPRSVPSSSVDSDSGRRKAWAASSGGPSGLGTYAMGK